MVFKTGEKVLFIGDSITEDGRFDDPKDIGVGYVQLIRDYINENLSDLQVDVVNRGVGGDRVTNLADRWETDVISEDPDWVSISIGINDVWRQLDNPDMEQVSPELFEKTYDELLHILKEHTEAKLILMEPTIIEEDVNSVGNALLKPYVETVKKLAHEYNAVLVSTHQTFLNFIEKTPKASLTTDGVHMNDLGRKLMATTWLVGTGVMSK